MGKVIGSSHARMPAVRCNSSRRLPAPAYCIADLKAALLGLVKRRGSRNALDMGLYSSIMLGHAVRGRGLAELEPLISCLLSVSPAGILKHGDLKKAILSVSMEIDGLCPLGPGQSLDRWASQKAERCFVVLNHVRRLAQSPVRWRQSIRSLDSPSIEILSNIKNQVLEQLPLPSKLENDIGPEDSVSQVQVPKDMEEDPKEKLVVVRASSKSYIQVCSGTKKSLLVGCSSKQHKDHQNLITLVAKYMTEHHSTAKALATELRDFLLA